MKILVSNDDGVYAPGLWTLIKKLKNSHDIIVSAPDREQSGIGTAITLHHPLRVQRVKSEIQDIPTYAVSGTPGDSVIMALSDLVDGKPDLIISGINNGLNLGDDVFISGTVGGAMHAYFHGFSTISVSLEVGSPYLDYAARFTAFLIERLDIIHEKDNFFLNVNLPEIPSDKIKGIKIGRLSTSGYSDSVEEGYDGRRHYYWLKHKKSAIGPAKGSDAWALARGYITISPLHTYLFNKKITSLDDKLKALASSFTNNNC
jgi:5'-nucleotidase